MVAIAVSMAASDYNRDMYMYDRVLHRKCRRVAMPRGTSSSLDLFLSFRKLNIIKGGPNKNSQKIFQGVLPVRWTTPKF